MVTFNIRLHVSLRAILYTFGTWKLLVKFWFKVIDAILNDDISYLILYVESDLDLWSWVEKSAVQHQGRFFSFPFVNFDQIQ